MPRLMIELDDAQWQALAEWARMDLRTPQMEATYLLMRRLSELAQARDDRTSAYAASLVDPADPDRSGRGSTHDKSGYHASAEADGPAPAGALPPQE